MDKKIKELLRYTLYAIRSRRRRAGFTLIEVLVIVFLLGIVLVMGLNLFFSILKGGSKAEITKEVKQNGDYAISVMERMIRNAQEAACDEEGVEITNLDGETTKFFRESSEGVFRVASNSGTYLTSKNVTVTAWSCTCGETTPEVVTISFTLSPSEAGVASAQNFKTTVSQRTYD